MPSWIPPIASILLAAFPVGIWLRIVNQGRGEKSLLIKTFLLGTFAVIPPLLLILLFEKFPEFNIYAVINRSVEQIAFAILLTNIVVGVVEEIAKNLIVRIIDKRHPEYIQTISGALRLSLCAGLGFAFAENIFYFYTISSNPHYNAADLFSTFIFRSVFTMCGHMVFSGIFGYYFGIGKFAADITEAARWQGSGQRFSRWLSKLTGRMTFQVIREQKNMIGLLLAMSLHALFNVSLDLQYKIPPILIVVLGALYIAYLLQTKTGHLFFNVSKRRASSMVPRDQDVVMELLGMSLKEGRLEEVITICDRLLLRDPDNNVVKLFRAKASDDQKLRHVYNALKNIIGKEKKQTVGEAALGSLSPEHLRLTLEDEKVILEVMEHSYKKEQYDKVLDIASRLLARNPQSHGARVLLEKAMDKEKLQKMFDSLTKLFEG